MADQKPDRAKVDEFYKNNFGWDPSKLTPEMRAKADDALKQMRPTRGRPVFGRNDPVLQARADFEARNSKSPISAKLAQDLAVYDAWQNGELPPDVDAISDELIAKHKIAGKSVDDYKAKRDGAVKEWIAEKAGAYNHLVPAPKDAKKSDKEEREIVMEPEEIKAKSATSPPAAALAAAKGNEGAPPPGIAAPPDAIPPALAPSPAVQAGPLLARVERNGTTLRRIPGGS